MGTLLDSELDIYGDSAFPTFNTVTVTGAGINSISLLGGSGTFRHSVFYDNLTAVTAAVPEPSSLFLFAIAFLGLKLRDKLRQLIR